MKKITLLTLAGLLFITGCSENSTQAHKQTLKPTLVNLEISEKTNQDINNNEKRILIMESFDVPTTEEIRGVEFNITLQEKISKLKKELEKKGYFLLSTDITPFTVKEGQLEKYTITLVFEKVEDDRIIGA